MDATVMTTDTAAGMADTATTTKTRQAEIIKRKERLHEGEPLFSFV